MKKKLAAERMIGKFKQLRGHLKVKWGKLTQDEILEAAGKMEILSGLIQERYGKTKDETLKDVNEYFKGMAKNKH